jgi:DNA-binding SARP family transcriptional activator/class 3 adenylate cyclase
VIVVGGDVLTILFTDVVGSTDLRATLGDDAADPLIAAHLARVADIVGDHDGVVVKTLGDGVLATFRSARRALGCAAAIQRAEAYEDERVALRVGLDAGEVMERDGDVHGLAVASAARIVDLAKGGEILVGDLVRQLAGPEPSLRLVERGSVALKGVPHPVLLAVLQWADQPQQAAEATGPTLEVSLLGQQRVLVKGAALEALPSARSLELLAYLVLHRGVPQLRQHVAGVFWPESTEDQARSNLRHELHRLRTAIPEADRCLRADTRTVCWSDDAPARVDVTEFEAALAEADTAEERGDAPGFRRAAERAAKAYGGDLLPGIYEDWVLAERERLRRAAIGLLDRLSGALANQGELRAAVHHARRRVDLDPLEESGYRQLMEAQDRAGDRAAALATYHRCTSTLRRELDVEPSAETVAMYRNLFAKTAAPVYAAPQAPEAASRAERVPERQEFPLPGALRTRSRFPFVGRAAEQETLEEAWKRAATGERQAVLVGGEPGVGKTRLAAETARTARDEGGVVLAGRCDEEGGVPYQPFVEALDTFIGHCPEAELVDRLGRFGGDLERIVPGLSERVPGLSEPLRADEDKERRRLFDALTGWLAAAGGGRPVVLVFDDLHWADKTTLLALRHVLRFDKPFRLLFIGNYRDTELDRTHSLVEMRAELRRERAVERIDLRGLTADEVRTFLEGAGGHEREALADELVLALHRGTEGNPFFLEETLAHLIETGVIYQRGDGRWTSDLDKIEGFGIPEGVREVIGRRLARLSEECHRVLGMAAVLGAEFDVAALNSLAGADVVDPLEEAETSGLVAATGSSLPGYGFTHALVRHTLLDQLSLARRQSYHLAAAETLEARGGGAAAVATHYRQAGAAADLEKTVNASLAAAEAARQRLAWEEASDHWEATLELLELSGRDPAEKAGLIERLGDAIYATGRDWERGIHQLERAVEINEGLGDAYRAAKIRSRIARNLAAFPGRFDPARASAHAEAARPALEERGDSPALAYLETSFALVHALRLQGQEGLTAARRSLEIGERVGHPAVIASATGLVGVHLVLTGRVREGLAYLEAAQSGAVEMNLPMVAWNVSWLTSGMAFLLSDPLLQASCSRQELDSGRLEGAPELRRVSELMLGMGLLDQGRLGEARSHLEVAPPTELSLRLHELVIEGHWEEAATAAQPEVTDAEAVRNSLSAAGDAWMAAQAAWVQDDTVTATQQLEKALCITEQGDTICDLVVTPDLVRAWWARGEPDRANAQLRRLEDLASRIDDPRGLGCRLHLARGIATSDHAPATAQFEKAIEIARHYRAIWLEAESFELWGIKTARAEPLDAALGIYERIGAAEPWIERARRLRSRVVDQ